MCVCVCSCVCVCVCVCMRVCIFFICTHPFDLQSRRSFVQDFKAEGGAKYSTISLQKFNKKRNNFKNCGDYIHFFSCVHTTL